ncbi:MAG: glycoside hydrolase family 3 N-terminal domain-containing protein, partial [Longimicrobiales bacterium]
MNVARLLFPAIRWDAERGFEPARPAIESALQLGVSGFILFGGHARAVRALTDELQARSAHPLLIGADLERGAGQQFAGATPLPPLAAIGFLDDLEVTRRAGELTAREARALGVNWVYAPDADVDVEPRNPIIGTRAFGTSAEKVTRHVQAWIDGCHQGGALACAKHFPGHGRTTVDSHAELPVVNADRATLLHDLEPFQAAIRARVDSVMSAHISFPAFDPSGAAATLSPAILTGLLREQLGFGGLIVTDALIMQGVLDAGQGEAGAVVAAVRAGCDALLYPTDLQRVTSALQQAVSQNGLRERVHQSIERIQQAAQDAARAGARVASTEGWGLEPD